MTTATIPPQDFYVYVLYREDSVTPFYIGKGRRNRWLDHERDVRKPNGSGNRHKDAIVKAMLLKGIKVPKEKLIENLTEALALQLEADLIRLVGRCPLGPLVNQTDGGNGGVNPSPETREKLRQRMTGRFVSEETRARQSAACRSGEPEMRAKISAAKKGKPNPLTPEGRAAISAAAGARLRNLSGDMRQTMTHGFAVLWRKSLCRNATGTRQKHHIRRVIGKECAP